MLSDRTPLPNKRKSHISVGKNYILEDVDNPNQGFPGGSVVKNQPANAGDPGLIPGLGRSPEGRNGPTQVFLPKKSHG